MGSLLISDSDFVELVELAYHAGCDPARWRNFVEGVQRHVPFGAFSAILAVDGTHLIQSSASAGHDPANLETYYSYYHALNCYEPLLLRVPIGKVITGTELAPRDWLKHQTFFNEWLVPSGNFTRGCTLTMAKDERRLLRAFFDLPERHASMEDDSARLLARLGPHIMRAFELNEKLGAAAVVSDSLDALLAKLDGAAFVIAGDGRILLHNKRAEALLNSAVCVRLVAGRYVRFNAPADQSAYDCARIAAVDATHPAPQPFRIASAGSQGSIATVSPLRALGAAGDKHAPAALLVIKPLGGAPRDVRHILRRLFGLTEREALVAEAIGDGSSPADVAQAIGVTRVTVRNQLAAVLAKMGVNRQAEVVAIIANLTPRLSDDDGRDDSTNA